MISETIIEEIDKFGLSVPVDPQLIVQMYHAIIEYKKNKDSVETYEMC